jgi:hypothetical protein
LQQPPTARRTAYTILRELVDNVDDRHGMVSSAFYVSATPDLFDSEKGITEYEALASRVLMPAPVQDSPPPNPAGTVVDLSSMPLSRGELLEIASRIASLYGVAKHCQPDGTVRDRLGELLADTARRDPDFTIRSWVRAVVNLLDGLRSGMA